MNIFQRIAIVLAAFVPLALLGGGAAMANHDTYNYNIQNNTSSTFHARCTSHYGGSYVWEDLRPGYSTELNGHLCNAFSVGDNRNVQYRSNATGAIYWSGCGRYLPHTSPFGAYGWEYIGNDVTLLKVAIC